MSADDNAPEQAREVEDLRRWKAEAMEVIDGLQEVGRALGVGLGERITARATVDRALDLRNERNAAVAQHAAWCDWLAAIGFGIDFSFNVPPPCSLADLAEAMHRADPRESADDWAWCVEQETRQQFRNLADGVTGRTNDDTDYEQQEDA